MLFKNLPGFEKSHLGDVDQFAYSMINHTLLDLLEYILYCTEYIVQNLRYDAAYWEKMDALCMEKLTISLGNARRKAML